LAEAEERHQSDARWPTIPLFPGENVQLAGMRAPLSNGAMAASKLALAYAAGLAEAFDILGFAAVMLDNCGRVISANRTAKTTLTTELRIVRGRLTASDRETSKKILQLVDQATSSREGPALRSPVAVPRRARRPLVVYAFRLAGEARGRSSSARALILILDFEARPAPAETHLQHIFGLTSAESRLAVQLARGAPLKTAANALEVAKETARTQLRAVFAKTETSRQTELIALIGRLLSDRPGSAASPRRLG
jgi:DNA-binding CsgD family transcriptional regulator